jgi:ribosomal 50S subunit-recycling heat shock protein
MKLARIVKRRSLAEDLCREGLVKVDGRVAKPSHRVKTGQHIEVRLGRWLLEFEVLAVPEKNLHGDYVKLVRREEVEDI